MAMFWAENNHSPTMGALAIFALARRLVRYALDLMHRKPLTIDKR